MTDLSADIAALPDRSLLVLDDDAPLRTRLGRALEQRGFEPVLVGSVGEALAAAWLARKACGQTVRLTSIARVGKLILFAVAPATAASAVLAADVLTVLDRSFNEVLGTWFAAHALGMAIVLPSVLLILRADTSRDFERDRLEQVGLYGLVAALCLGGLVADRFPVPLLIFPALTLVAFRLGPRGAAVAALIVATLCASLVLREGGPANWTTWTIVEKTRTLQLLIAAGFLTSLSTALAIADQKRLKRLWASRSRVARAAEARAVAAGRAKAEFLATMSHEIRTPMNSIIGFTEVLLRRDDLPEPARRQLTLVDRASASLLTVVNDILDFSKMEAGEVELTCRPATARSVAQDALAIVAEAARRKGLSVQLAFVGPVEATVMLDELRTRQVLLNLLSNAIKFTEEGRISLDVLALEAEGGLTLRFSVTDTGPGVAPDKVERLFKRFSQLDSSRGRAHGGAGLGLAISKGLVELMGGKLGVDSAPGVGSVFWFEIPVASAKDLAAPEEPGLEPRPLGARVLLVDDHPVNLELATTVLQLLGCAVIQARDGEQAVAAARQGGCDLILMDVHMPRMDGLEATRQIRALDGPAARIPIIGMSADVLPDMETACLKAGMNAAVGKPISIGALHAALAKWLGPAGDVRAA